MSPAAPAAPDSPIAPFTDATGSARLPNTSTMASASSRSSIGDPFDAPITAAT